MSAMSRMDHQSSVYAEKAYTSYKWLLNDWSLLYNHHYSKNIISPEFVLTNTGGCCCKLILKPGKDGSHYGSLDIIPSHIIDFCTSRATLSIVNEKMNKLLTFESVYAKTFPQPAKIDFTMALTETSVNKYLIKDTLILLFEVTIVTSVKDSSLETQSYTESLMPSIQQNLNEIRKDQSLCDITFVIGDEKFPAHKVILAAYSDVFKAMFTCGMKEQDDDTVDIVDTDPTVFAAFLDFIYNGKVNNQETQIGDLLVVADKYQICDLKNLCENLILSNLDNANVISYLLTAHKLGCKVLKAKAINLVKTNTSVLANAANFQLLSNYPELIEEVFRTD